MASDPEGAGTLEARLPATVAEEPRPVPRRRRAFLLVSVRGLLLLILIIGCALGMIARIARTGALQHRAVAAIYRAGGWVVYDTEWDQRRELFDLDASVAKVAGRPSRCQLSRQRRFRQPARPRDRSGAGTSRAIEAPQATASSWLRRYRPRISLPGQIERLAISLTGRHPGDRRRAG